MALINKVKIEVLVVDFYENTGWEINYNGYDYNNVIVKDERFLKDVKKGYYSFTRGTKLIADVSCPLVKNENFIIEKVYEVLL